MYIYSAIRAECLISDMSRPRYVKEKGKGREKGKRGMGKGIMSESGSGSGGREGGRAEMLPCRDSSGARRCFLLLRWTDGVSGVSARYSYISRTRYNLHRSLSKGVSGLEEYEYIRGGTIVLQSEWRDYVCVK